MKRLLITRPRFDYGTQYLYSFSKAVIDEAEEHSWRVEDIDDDRANRREVQSRLSRNPPSLVVFNGHGSASEICGHNDEVLVDGESASLLQHTIAFARACGCLSELGPAAVRKGCRAFVGYRRDFFVPRVNEYNARPLEDPSAKPVLKASNAIPLALVKGQCVGEAVEASRRATYKHAMRMLASNEPYDSPALRALLQNDDALGFEGDENATCQ